MTTQTVDVRIFGKTSRLGTTRVRVREARQPGRRRPQPLRIRAGKRNGPRPGARLSGLAPAH
jgi:hypothetical protein